MSDDEFERVFGTRPREERPSFADRVARGEAFGGRIDPRPAMAVEAATVAPTPGEYRAFGFLPTGNVNVSCEVRWWMEGTNVPEGLVFPYRLLMQIGFAGDNTLRLLLPHCCIQLAGRKLNPLTQALMRQQVTFIQQWNAKVWTSSRQNYDSIIDTIEIVYT